MSREPEKVTAGERITLPIIGGEQPWEGEVLPACEISEPNSGHWACAVHGDHSAGLGGILDWKDGCRAVWVCHTHGPEEP